MSSRDFFIQMLMPISVFLIGLALGLHYNAFILIPAGVVVATTTLGVSIAAQDSFFTIVLVIVFAIVALQIGYVAGIVISNGVRQDLVSVPQVPIENKYGHAAVVHFHEYRLSKTQYRSFARFQECQAIVSASQADHKAVSLE
jgi:hypothetical protein